MSRDFVANSSSWRPENVASQLFLWWGRLLAMFSPIRTPFHSLRETFNSDRKYVALVKKKTQKLHLQRHLVFLKSWRISNLCLYNARSHYKIDLHLTWPIVKNVFSLKGYSFPYSFLYIFCFIIAIFLYTRKQFFYFFSFFFSPILRWEQR